MEADESVSVNQGTTANVPAVGKLRVIALHGPVLARRRAPRRRVVIATLIDRRHADRRRAKPGIDGLLRTVLADDWQ